MLVDKTYPENLYFSELRRQGVYQDASSASLIWASADTASLPMFEIRNPDFDVVIDLRIINNLLLKFDSHELQLNTEEIQQLKKILFKEFLVKLAATQLEK